MKKVVPFMLCVFYLYTFLYPVLYYANEKYHVNEEQDFQVNGYYLGQWRNALGYEPEGIPEEYADDEWSYVTDHVGAYEGTGFLWHKDVLNVILWMSKICFGLGIIMLIGIVLKKRIFFYFPLICSFAELMIIISCAKDRFTFEFGDKVFVRPEYPLLRVIIVCAVLLSTNESMIQFLNMTLKNGKRKMVLFAIMAYTVLGMFLGQEISCWDGIYSEYARMRELSYRFSYESVGDYIFNVGIAEAFLGAVAAIIIAELIRWKKAPAAVSMLCYLIAFFAVYSCNPYNAYCLFNTYPSVVGMFVLSGTVLVMILLQMQIYNSSEKFENNKNGVV